MTDVPYNASVVSVIRLLIVVLTALLQSCAGQQLGGAAIRSVLDAAQEPAPRLSADGIAAPPTRFRLALYFVRRDFPTHRGIHKAEWLGTDRDALRRRLMPLRDDGVLQEVFVLEDSTIHSPDIGRIRRAAARYGADAVLIVDGAGAVERSNNAKAWLYATVIGAYLASGTECDALFLVQGSLWDVRQDRLFLNQEAEGKARQIGPALLLEDRAVLRQAQTAALETLASRMADALRRRQ